MVSEADDSGTTGFGWIEPGHKDLTSSGARADEGLRLLIRYRDWCHYFRFQLEQQGVSNETIVLAARDVGWLEERFARLTEALDAAEEQKADATQE